MSMVPTFQLRYRVQVTTIREGFLSGPVIGQSERKVLQQAFHGPTGLVWVDVPTHRERDDVAV
jgi:hypothetical protein